MNPDQLAELEEERKFLLRSLVDLEREHSVGDVDDVDYHELKEGYTVRAAATLRAIDEGRNTLPPKPKGNWSRRLLMLGGVVVSVLAIWWALATWSPGQEITGLDPRSEQQQLMAQARAIQFQSPGEAADLYAQVLAADPDNVEALTYRGWTLALDAVQAGGADSSDASDDVVAELRDAIDSLSKATDLDPTYPDPKCFLGIVNFRILRQPAAAQPWVEACLAANPPSDIRDLVAGMNEEIAAALADG